MVVFVALHKVLLLDPDHYLRLGSLAELKSVCVQSGIQYVYLYLSLYQHMYSSSFGSSEW